LDAGALSAYVASVNGGAVTTTNSLSGRVLKYSSKSM